MGEELYSVDGADEVGHLDAVSDARVSALKIGNQLAKRKNRPNYHTNGRKL